MDVLFVSTYTGCLRKLYAIFVINIKGQYHGNI